MWVGKGGPIPPRLGIKGDTRLLDMRLLEAGVREAPIEKGLEGSMEKELDPEASEDLADWAFVEPVFDEGCVQVYTVSPQPVSEGGW